MVRAEWVVDKTPVSLTTTTSRLRALLKFTEHDWIPYQEYGCELHDLLKDVEDALERRERPLPFGRRATGGSTPKDILSHQQAREAIGGNPGELSVGAEYYIGFGQPGEDVSDSVSERLGNDGNSSRRRDDDPDDV